MLSCAIWLLCLVWGFLCRVFIFLVNWLEQWKHYGVLFIARYFGPGWRLREFHPWWFLIQESFRSSQRFSLPEILWRALTKLWTALRTNFFRAMNQCRTVLLQRWFFWNSSDSELNSTDFWRIQNDAFWLLFQFFQIFSSTSFLRHIIQIISPICEKKWTKNI